MKMGSILSKSRKKKNR